MHLDVCIGALKTIIYNNVGRTDYLDREYSLQTKRINSKRENATTTMAEVHTHEPPLR